MKKIVNLVKPPSEVYSPVMQVMIDDQIGFYTGLTEGIGERFRVPIQQINGR